MGILDVNGSKPDGDPVKRLLSIGLVIGFPVFLGYFWAREVVKTDSFILVKIPRRKRIQILAVVLLTAGILAAAIVFLGIAKGWIYLIYLTVPIFAASAAFSFAFAEVILKKDISYQLKESLLKKPIICFNAAENALLDKSSVPIGMSFTTGKVTTLQTDRRHEHIMITGGTGQGKTSLAISLLRHDMVWNRPAIFVDPKGDREDIATILKYGKLYGREKDIYVFSLAEENEFYYDPLAFGKPESKVDKLIQTLTFEHDYYKSVAENVLSIIFTIFDYKNQHITLSTLEGLLLSKERLQRLLDEVPEILRTIADNDEKQSLIDKVNRFRSIKNEEIMGIQSKISRLNNKELKGKINANSGKIKLSIVDAIENNKILIFDIKAGEFSSLSKVLGRMILKDLEMAASLMQDRKLSVDCDFVAVYFDEFDTFATENFHEFIKTARSGRMALTLMFQSVAGINQINEHLADHATTNSLNSIHFRANSSTDLDYIANLCGTEERKQSSNQIDQKNMFGRITGKGTEFATENYRISPNLIRSLKYGQCVVYKKGSNEIDLVQAWHGKKELAQAKSIEDLRRSSSSTNHEKKTATAPKIMSRKEAAIQHLKPTERVRYLTFSEAERARELAISIQKN